MPYVSAKEMIQDAKNGKYAVGHFNLNNMESIRAYLLAAEEMKSPVILGVSGGTAKYMGGYKTIVATVTSFIDYLKISVPVALHVDHGTYEEVLDAIESGFSSVMFDGSALPIEENIEKTRYILGLCREKGISLECEVGAIGGEEDGVAKMGEYADPNECAKMAELGIDMLAAGIGNIHGKYPKDWPGLRFDILEEIQKATNGIPLVLHGGSEIPTDMIKKAISMGVCKINVNTECQIAFTQAVREYIEEGRDLVGKGFTPRALLAPGLEASKQVAIEKMQLFGSVNKA
ncbi:MAG: class II fructose-1,6-bisphosphate aldolase [Clostridiales bacterium]|jgi:fructose-bisphosphate aldolase class II|nr:class II fructose-1,6-bisphosphate aldolase [Clostridiales bacterium]HOL78713.1 class II fructose-1,6-bisphosphate aldolase [Clostridiales bacterium]HPP67743.1 class II fructose-1,6-bisphosphate aldolase [Clostridiales bacterium]HPU67100.1 class II fructose-1,6-bisphosphate aldolase [Clostridiales bacterium]HQA04895.1 class II fructose-1,6-bisphosphate aldolase [Clostridiales bacterium]